MDIIWITAPISILNIDQSQFVKFVEAQRQHFRIFITLPNNNDDLEVEQSLDRLFSRHFEVWPFDEYGDYCGRTIYINWMSSGIRRERAYLFPKDCDPRAYLYIPKKKDKKCTVM
uniref:Uncharacterized protein n=1 Tax=Panagrellus redivivus TaxID=6233 RepID=A0A7E4UNW6_PANRE